MIGANPDDVMLLSSAQSTKLPLPSLPPLPWQHCQLRVMSMAPSASSDEGTRTPKKWTFHDLKGMLVVSSSTLKLPGLYRHTDCIFIRIISLAHAPEKKRGLIWRWCGCGKRSTGTSAAMTKKKPKDTYQSFSQKALRVVLQETKFTFI